eukprot:GHVS01041421.1.p1 GENE.GHVS01041421.1~~GHVS01041421.1.p1  ORF type:complete len:217 (+),score=14.22 GHVS01041421.1:119-769(+)
MVAAKREKKPKKPSTSVLTTKPMITITIKRKQGKRLETPLKKQVRAPRLRHSLVPGTVVILLNGPYKGRRAVLMKILPSGLLLLNGPFQLNRIPLRRASQRFVIATSTRLDISNVDMSKFDDCYFQRSKKEKILERKDRKSRSRVGGGDDSEALFMSEEKTKVGVERLPEIKIQDQKTVDTALLASIKKHKEPLLSHYLKSRFSLSDGQYPHQMLF